MNRYERKRLWHSRLLLCVFVPMLLLASVHTHQPATSVPADCYDCSHHLHHDGHLSSDTLSIDSCPLCHFLATAFVAAAVVSVFFSATAIAKAVGVPNAGIPSSGRDAVRPRAPPARL